jgi:hypothetical protein
MRQPSVKSLGQCVWPGAPVYPNRALAQRRLDRSATIRLGSFFFAYSDSGDSITRPTNIGIERPLVIFNL